jgi:hypothetical protein
VHDNSNTLKRLGKAMYLSRNSFTMFCGQGEVSPRQLISDIESNGHLSIQKSCEISSQPIVEKLDFTGYCYPGKSTCGSLPRYDQKCIKIGKKNKQMFSIGSI